MNRVKFFAPVFLMFAIAALPALAQIAVASPTNGQQVPDPFNLTMNASTCSSQPVTYVGYSLDNGTYTAIFAGQAMNGPVSAANGWHTVHIKVWNTYGAVCLADVSVDVVGGGTASIIPSNAVTISNIETLGSWSAIHDGGTPGSSSGAMSLSGTMRLYANQFNDFGGERYSTMFDTDNSSTNFFYDTWVYIANDSNGFSNLEFDLNQTMPSGETVIMGFQCDSWNNTWDYTVNGGSPTASWDTWLHSTQPCNVHTWAPNSWHHVQIWNSHDYNGWVTYHAVWLDGVQQNINATVFSGFALGWGPAITTQFQIDGNSSGTTWGNVYLDHMTVYRW